MKSVIHHTRSAARGIASLVRGLFRRVLGVVQRAWKYLASAAAAVGQAITGRVCAIRQKLRGPDEEITREEAIRHLQDLLAELEALPFAA